MRAILVLTCAGAVACGGIENELEFRSTLQVETDGIALSGWLGLPTFNRSQADMQYWFVNGRSISDRTLSHAAKHAYRDVLFHGRFPAYVLTTLVCMAPGTVAFTYIGYVGREAAAGGEGLLRKALLALGLLAAVVFLPRLVRRLRGRS